MGTKWKKCKVICSSLAFVAGMSLLIVNLVPAAALLAAFGMDVFGMQQPDYQKSAEFRHLIGGRLSDLLGVATGGKTFSLYGAGYGYDSVVDGYTSYSYVEDYDRYLNDTAVVQEETAVEESLDSMAASGEYSEEYLEYLAEQRAHYNEMVAAEYGFADTDEYTNYYNGYYGYESLDDYMADMACNKNILYAVVYQDKLLYTNIESYEGKTGKAWEGADFSEGLDAKAYNFTLWYNRTGDGKVQITKDGRKEDVYGDGVYSDYSRWKVPGYANYKMGESSQNAVIFLAAAKVPQLYMVGNDEGNHVKQYGDRLYQMRWDALFLHNTAERRCLELTISVILLGISILMRKSRRLGVKAAADFLGKLYLECKILLVIVLLTVFVNESAGVLGQLGWWLRQGFLYYNWSGDYIYEVKKYMRAGGCLAILFWLIYLVVLDWRMNGKRQKKPLFDLLKVKDFKYPIQKRLVRRQRLTLIAELILIVLFAVSICVLHLFTGEYLNYLTGGYAYDYGYDAMTEAVTEVIAEGGGNPFGIGSAYMLTAYVIFSALFVFTAITFCSLKKNHRLAMDIGALNDQILAVREGNLTEKLTLSEDTDLREAAENLNEIQKGMETALREQMKSERMKVDLVTNVSHDIKTPLTSIISYVELLRQEQDLPEHVQEFIRILGEKAERLRNIVQDVFEISKATSGQLPIRMEVLDMGKLLRQTLADMNDRIEQSSYTMKTAIPETPVPVYADGQRLYRVFQNLLQNALRYSLEGSRIFLSLVEEDGQVIVRVKNTSSMELADSKDFTERFVRGDESRTDGGSGLGLSIAKSFTEACGGSLSVETNADLFTVTVSFPRSGQGQTEEKPDWQDEIPATPKEVDPV